jgi:hypothetical protein
VNLNKLCGLAALAVVLGCGGANGGQLGSGGDGGAPGTGGIGGEGGTGGPGPIDETNFRLGCSYDTLELDILFELVAELTEPYSASASTEATFGASIILDEKSVASFLDAGITKIDIGSALVTSNITGATPSAMGASLGDAPINDFDLEQDPDENGVPGPHRFDLDPATTTSTAAPGAAEVTFDLQFEGIRIALGDFNIPADCFGLSLVGVAMRFPVGP